MIAQQRASCAYRRLCREVADVQVVVRVAAVNAEPLNLTVCTDHACRILADLPRKVRAAGPIEVTMAYVRV